MRQNCTKNVWTAPFLTLPLFVDLNYDSLADTIVPLADSVFDATKVELSSSGRVKLYCVTYENMATIKVTACWLEKEVGGEWEFDCSLTPPAEESHNTDVYKRQLRAILASAMLVYPFHCSPFVNTGTFTFKKHQSRLLVSV